MAIIVTAIAVVVCNNENVKVNAESAGPCPYYNLCSFGNGGGLSVEFRIHK